MPSRGVERLVVGSLSKAWIGWLNGLRFRCLSPGLRGWLGVVIAGKAEGSLYANEDPGDKAENTEYRSGENML